MSDIRCFELQNGLYEVAKALCHQTTLMTLLLERGIEIKPCTGQSIIDGGFTIKLLPKSETK